MKTQDSNTQKFEKNKMNHASQTNQGNRDAKVKANANKQQRQQGQRASGNAGKDASNTR